MAHFWSIFTILGAKKFFLENVALSRTSSYGFLAPCQNLGKTNDTIPRKCSDSRKDRRTERLTDARCPKILKFTHICNL